MLDKGKVSIESVTPIWASLSHSPYQTVASISSMDFENVETKHVGRTWTMPERRESAFGQITVRSTNHQDSRSV